MIDFLKNSRKGANSPFNMAWGTNKSLWDWYAEPKEEWRFGRFVAAMQFVAETYKDSIFQNGESVFFAGARRLKLMFGFPHSVQLGKPQVYGCDCGCWWEYGVCLTCYREDVPRDEVCDPRPPTCYRRGKTGILYAQFVSTLKLKSFIVLESPFPGSDRKWTRKT